MTTTPGRTYLLISLGLALGSAVVLRDDNTATRAADRPVADDGAAGHDRRSPREVSDSGQLVVTPVDPAEGFRVTYERVR